MITTPRLVLREWRDTDRAPFAAMNADPRVMEFFPATLSREQSDALVDRILGHFAQRGYGLWAVEIPGVADFAGFIGLTYTTFDAPFTPCVEVGWRLAHGVWGRGYAPEGARAVVREGLTDRGVDSIVSFTSPLNVRSTRVMEKIGMTRVPEWDFDHPRVPAGHALQPHVVYRIDRNASRESNPFQGCIFDSTASGGSSPHQQDPLEV